MPEVCDLPSFHPRTVHVTVRTFSASEESILIQSEWIASPLAPTEIILFEDPIKNPFESCHSIRVSYCPIESVLFLMVTFHPNPHPRDPFSIGWVERFETVNGTMGLAVDRGVGIDVGVGTSVGVGVGANVGLGRGVAVGSAAMVASTASAIADWRSKVGVVGREVASMVGGDGVGIVGDELAQAVDASAKSTNTPDATDLLGCTSESSIATSDHYLSRTVAERPTTIKL